MSLCVYEGGLFSMCLGACQSKPSGLYSATLTWLSGISTLTMPSVQFRHAVWTVIVSVIRHNAVQLTQRVQKYANAPLYDVSQKNVMQTLSISSRHTNGLKSFYGKHTCMRIIRVTLIMLCDCRCTISHTHEIMLRLLGTSHKPGSKAFEHCAYWARDWGNLVGVQTYLCSSV